MTSSPALRSFSRPRSLRFLVAESEPPKARHARRKSVGRSSGETYIDTLYLLVPGAVCERVKPGDRNAELPDNAGLQGYDAVFITGSPLHLYQDTPETRREVEFMRGVFASGTPSFGSCAGLQVAVVAAGGSVRPSGNGREAGFARRIVPTGAGQKHPLLAGRPISFDAPAFHSDEVDTLPGMRLGCSGASNTILSSICTRLREHFDVKAMSWSMRALLQTTRNWKSMRAWWRNSIITLSGAIWLGASAWMSR